MREATRLTRAGRLLEATAAIQRSLRADNEVPVTPLRAMPQAAATRSLKALSGASIALSEIRNADARVAETRDPAQRTHSGEFIAGKHTDAALTRSYKLYVPHGHVGKQLPLIVMLHGCTQDPDDFAAGTRMNALAQEEGFLVLYPAQSQGANASRCWNWFKHTHQTRGHGEPALLAGMTQAVIQQYGIDARRVYLAGLSAGGAMAVIVAAAYPDIFAAVGVHSGLPRGAASNVSQALAAMKSGAAGANRDSITVPTIVFHGDSDQTVHPRNGEQVIEAVTVATTAESARVRVEQGVSAQGRRYTRSIHTDAKGNIVAEHWLVHGIGHAWSGGNADGSYTDSTGPDASSEMLRFFMERPAGPVC